MQNFEALGAPLPNPHASGGWGLCPQTPTTAPSLPISGYAPELAHRACPFRVFLKKSTVTFVLSEPLHSTIFAASPPRHNF